MARAWRKISTTPGRSGKAARPVSGRTRHTGSGWQTYSGLKHISERKEGRCDETSPVHSSGRKSLWISWTQHAVLQVQCPHVIVVFFLNKMIVRNTDYSVSPSFFMYLMTDSGRRWYSLANFPTSKLSEPASSIRRCISASSQGLPCLG